MVEKLLSFKLFKTLEEAQEMKNFLNEKNIIAEIEENRNSPAQTLALNPLNKEYRVMLKSEDFEMALKSIETHYSQDLSSVDPEHYLFSFTDDELMEILRKPDEWGDLDYPLAKKILIDRGIEIRTDMTDSLKRERLLDLSKPDTVNSITLFSGYLFALMGGFFGLLIGWSLINSRKVLPNGNHIYRYSDKTRNQGKTMVILGTISLVFWVSLKIYYS